MSVARWRWMALVGGAVAACFSNGLTGTIWGVWLAPVLLLAFVMHSRVRVGFAAMVGVWTIAAYVMFRGSLPVSDGEYVVMSVIGGLIASIPYLAHRLAAPHLDRISATLVFPAISTALAFLAASGTPFGTWGNEAYTQIEFGPLAQIASVVGLWGINFIIGWFASTLVAFLTGPARRAAPAAAVFALCFTAVIAFGLYRQQTSFDDSPTVRIAALSNPADVADRFFEGCADRSDLACRSARARSRWERLFGRSEAAVQQGARVVIWYESAAQYDKPIEDEFLTRAKAFARDNGIYLIVGAAVAPVVTTDPLENKAMAFTPQGELAFTYHKARPVPGEPIRAGDGIIPTLDTPYGRLGAMICFDADFPDLSRQAAARGVDILAVPSNDWRGITPLHGEMVRFRAIESGFSVVRPTSNGLTMVADPLGRALRRVNSFDDPGAIAIADVPARRVDTLYAVVDDLFAGLCLLASLGLLALALARAVIGKRRARMAHQSGN